VTILVILFCILYILIGFGSVFLMRAIYRDAFETSIIHIILTVIVWPMVLAMLLIFWIAEHDFDLKVCDRISNWFANVGDRLGERLFKNK
jgi:uncharacterized membrane protein YozB (DUF420 family)